MISLSQSDFTDQQLDRQRVNGQSDTDLCLLQQTNWGGFTTQESLSPRKFANKSIHKSLDDLLGCDGCRMPAH